MIDRQKKTEFAKFQKEYTAKRHHPTQKELQPLLRRHLPAVTNGVPKNVTCGTWNRGTQVLGSGQEGSRTEHEKLLKNPYLPHRPSL